jgi:hypothetical protein
MASKRRQRRRRCVGKQALTKEAAIKAAHRMKQKYPGQAFDGYKCETCGNWHVGHRTRNNQIKISQNRKNREADK